MSLFNWIVMPQSKVIKILWILVIVSGLTLYLANLKLGELNQDEGWYLYTASLVANGEKPYRDFAYTQGPLMPITYALAYPIVSMGGLEGGRVFTALLGLLGAVVASMLAGRLVPREWKGLAILMTFTLIVINTYQSYYTTIIKSYSLTGVFVAGGFFALSFCEGNKKGTNAMLAGTLFALAASTRFSAGIILPVVFIYLVMNRKRLGHRGWICFAVASVLIFCGVVLPFALAAPEEFYFGTVQFHAGRTGGSMLHKVGFISRTLQAYFVAAGLALTVFCYRVVRFGKSSEKREIPAGRKLSSIIWVGLSLVTIIHIAAPFPYEDYQVFLYPVFCAVISASFLRLSSEVFALRQEKIVWTTMVVCLLAAAAASSSPILQSWFVKGRDRIWWKMKEQSQLAKLQETAAWIKQQNPGEILLTQDTYLAVETGLQVPKGLAMGPFSYFPDLTTEQAKKFNVVNNELMFELLQNCPASYAVLSGYSLSIRSPEIQKITMEQETAFWKAVHQRYVPVKEVPDFGQGYTKLRILKRKP